MHYYIDGYNLMYRMMRSGDDFKHSRESLIRSLSDKIEIIEIPATVVFDAQYREGDSTRSHLMSLEICFTDKGETADDHIIKRLKAARNPREETVVTSDGKLAWRARRCLAHTMTVEAFVKFVDHKYRKAHEPKERSKRLPSLEKSAPTIKRLTEAEEESAFYLAQFEARAGEEPQDLPSIPSVLKKSKAKRKKQKPPKSNEPALSEYERWLKIFEARQPEDSED